MTVRLVLALLPALCLPAAWSCTGCAGRPEGQGQAPDLATIDTFRVLDRLRPDGSSPVCGGSRRVKPEEVKRVRGFPCGKGCRQVTFGAPVYEYDVSEDLLVYSGGGTLDRQVYMVDLKLDREWLIHAVPAKKPGCFTVATDGRTLAYSCQVWPDMWSIALPIQVYDPIDREEVEKGCWMVDPEKSAVPSYLSLGKQGIIMQMSLVSPQAVDAFFFRFSDNTFTNVSQHNGGVWFTHMSGTRAVWTQAMWKQGESGYTQIMLYDTQTGMKRLLAPHDSSQYMSRIKGDRVVWMDNRNSPGDHLYPGNSDIYMHDLKTGLTTAVSTHPARQDTPDVDGDLVVWEDWRNNPKTIAPKYSSEYQNSDVYLMDLGSGQETQLTAFAAKGYKDFETKPRVVGRRVLFVMSYQVGMAAVFMIDLDQALGR